jgi:hypothetical protein
VNFFRSVTGACLECGESNAGQNGLVIAAFCIPLLMILFCAVRFVKSLKKLPPFMPPSQGHQGGRRRVKRQAPPPAPGGPHKRRASVTTVAATFMGTNRDMASRRISVMTKFRILVSLFQVIKQVPNVYKLEMPDVFASCLRLFSAVDMDLMGLIQVCVYSAPQ